MPAETASRILRLNSVLDRTGLSRSTLDRKIARGAFPKQVRISERCIGWREGDIERSFSRLPLSARQMAVDRMRTDFREHGRWWATLLTVGQLRYDVNPRLPAIAAPTLLIFGSAAPPFLRLHEEQAAAAIPKARLERVPGASAHSPFDAPETYVPLLVDFLENGDG